MYDIQYYIQKSKVIYIMFNYEFLKIDYLNYSSLLYYACEFYILAPDGATLTSFSRESLENPKKILRKPFKYFDSQMDLCS